MKVTVINLDRSKDRRRQVSTRLRTLGMDFEIHRAVDALEFPEECKALVDWHGSYRDGIHVHMGSVANWISQCQVFREMVENGPSVMAVLEDDADPSNELPVVLSELATMTDQFDIVFLNFGPDRPFVPHYDLSSGHRLGRLRWSHFGTQGYVITRRAAKIFLQHYPLARTGIDRALASYWRHGLRTFCLRPAVVGHVEHFQGKNSLKLQAAVVRRQDTLWRLRRGWFKTREGAAKRIVFAHLMLDAHGLLGGLRRVMWPG